MFTDRTFSFVLSMPDDPFNGTAFRALRNVLFAEAGAAVLGLLVFVMTVLCFISIRKMSVLLCAVSALGLADAAVTLGTALGFCASADRLSEPVLRGTMFCGAVVTFLMFAVVFVLNLLVAVKGVDIEYGEGDLERAEIAKKSQARGAEPRRPSAADRRDC